MIPATEGAVALLLVVNVTISSVRIVRYLIGKLKRSMFDYIQNLGRPVFPLQTRRLGPSEVDQSNLEPALYSEPVFPSLPPLDLLINPQNKDHIVSAPLLNAVFHDASYSETDKEEVAKRQIEKGVHFRYFATVTQLRKVVVEYFGEEFVTANNLQRKTDPEVVKKKRQKQRQKKLERKRLRSRRLGNMMPVL